MIVYHGTSRRSWQNEKPGERSLYVTTKIWVAESYAVESAREHEDKGITDEPIVLTFNVNKLRSVVKEPDWGAFGTDKHTSWHKTMRDYGTFSLRGNIERLKKEALSLFRI